MLKQNRSCIISIYYHIYFEYFLEYFFQTYIRSDVILDIVGQDDLKEALVINYKRLIEEIEPRSFRQMFVDRREIKAKEYDAIFKLTSRRERAICLMRNILKRSGSTLKCFVDALEITGYKHLVQLINSRAGGLPFSLILQYRKKAQNNRIKMLKARFD